MVALNLLLKLGKRAAWNPHVLTRSVLKAWWNADDHGTANMTDDGAGLISAWVDRIGGLSVTAATTARPTYGATAFNSAYAGLTFDRVANALTGTTLTGLPVAATEGWTFAVGQVTTAAVAAQAIAGYGGASSNYRRHRISSAGLLSGADGAVNSNAFTLANGEQFIHGCRFESALLTSYQNGTIGTPSSATTTNTGTTRIRLGADTAAAVGTFYGGVLRHYMVTTALTTLQRQQIEGWLAWDSGLVGKLPSDHPYKLVPP